MAMTFIIVLSVILTALAAISLVKDFLIHFNVSDNGWKTAFAALLLVICFYCALLSYSGVCTVKDIYITLSMSQSSAADIERLENQLREMKVIAVASVGIGYGTYLLYLWLIRRFKENKMKQLELNKDQRWLGRI